ncbi:hypothetical protein CAUPRSCDRAFT_10304 [Caulochytrium protostelioides]|uniref:Uncharacterized protein n=1 Tax=Caulochytrium protostelioides TaxID=1555241 RepID=A0A4P9WX78_9FUNG|nr:hypothetical protein CAUPRSCDRAFT_10304 [Caulochytrium protostelioides]
MGMYPDPEAAAAASVLAARSAAFRSPYLAVPIAPSLLSAPSAEEPAPAAAALAASQLEMPATAAGAAGAQVASARRTRHAGQPLTRHLSVSTRRPGHLIPDATGEINSAPAESMNWRRGLPASPALALSGGDPSPMAPAASAPALEEDEIDDGVDGVTDAHAHAAKGAGDYDDSVATGSKRARRSDAADASVTTATIASAAAACKTAARRAARMSMSIDVHARAVGAGEDALPPTGTPRLEPFSASDVVSPAGMGVSLPEGSGDSPVIPSPASDAGSADGGSMRGTSLNDELSPMTPLAGVGGSASSGPVTAGTPSSKGRGRKTKVVYTACKVCNGARGLPLMKDGRGKCSYCNREKSMLAMRERKARERELELSARFEAGVAEGARRAQQQISVLQYRKNLAESDRDRLAADQEVLYENMGELEDLLMLASSAATWAEFKRRAADLDLRSASLETQLHRKAVASRSTMPDVAMDNAATTTTSTAGSSAPSHEATVVHGETLTTPTSTPTSTAGRLSGGGDDGTCYVADVAPVRVALADHGRMDRVASVGTPPGEPAVVFGGRSYAGTLGGLPEPVGVLVPADACTAPLPQFASINAIVGIDGACGGIDINDNGQRCAGGPGPALVSAGPKRAEPLLPGRRCGYVRDEQPEHDVDVGAFRDERCRPTQRRRGARVRVHPGCGATARVGPHRRSPRHVAHDLAGGRVSRSPRDGPDGLPRRRSGRRDPGGARHRSGSWRADGAGDRPRGGRRTPLQ